MIKLRSISSRLIITYIIIAILSAALFLTMVVFGLKSECVDNAESRLAHTSYSICEAYTENHFSSTSGADIDTRLKEIADFQDSRIWVYDKFGVKWFDVGASSGILDNKDEQLENNKARLEEVISKNDSGYTLTYDDDTYSTPIMSYASPIVADGEVVGYSIIHYRISDYSNTLSIVLWRGLYSLPLILAAALVLILMTARGINKPLISITNATKELAQGNFKMRADSTGLTDVGGIIESFNYMADELEKYENTRESFVSNVSHELRSPLTSIQGFVQGMLDGTIEQTDSRQYLETVLSETKRMNLLISDLLDLAKYESGQFPMNMTRWDINELIRQCFISFITKIEDKSLDVTINISDEKQMVCADKDRITQVLTNLIDNAVKFCDNKGQLKIWTHTADDGVISVSISNTGGIIPEEDIPYVFERFFKVDKSHNRRSPGTGIGLSIVKTIIQQHGQKIWVSSKRGMGTVFTFTLSDDIKTKGRNPSAIKQIDSLKR